MHADVCVCLWDCVCLHLSVSVCGCLRHVYVSVCVGACVRACVPGMCAFVGACGFVCLHVCVRVCVHMGMRLCGQVWVCGRSGLRVCGCVGVWMGSMHACMGASVDGWCVGACVHVTCMSIATTTNGPPTPSDWQSAWPFLLMCPPHRTCSHEPWPGSESLPPAQTRLAPHPSALSSLQVPGNQHMDAKQLGNQQLTSWHMHHARPLLVQCGVHVPWPMA